MGKIWIIDDDDLYVFICRKMLIRLGVPDADILTFPNGKKGFDYLCETLSNALQIPRLILLDINMPVMNGWDFLSQFETLSNVPKSDIKIAVLSSSVEPSDFEKAMSFDSVDKFISKPLKPEDVEEFI
jgi:CheY-like chemotaxis protein